jgi:hypothetical protein
MSLAIAGDDIIFKVCLKCGFDILKYANRARHQGPCFRCPECKSYTFVITCSECMFENSPECPLTQLLGRKHGIYKEDGDEEELRGRPCRSNWEQEGEVDEKEERSYSADFAEEQSCKLSTPRSEKKGGKTTTQSKRHLMKTPVRNTSNRTTPKRTAPLWKTQSRKTTTRTVQETLEAMCALIATKTYAELASQGI